MQINVKICVKYQRQSNFNLINIDGKTLHEFIVLEDNVLSGISLVNNVNVINVN